MAEDSPVDAASVLHAVDTLIENYNKPSVRSKFKGWHKALAMYFPDIERSCTLRIHGADGIDVIESMDETAAVQLVILSGIFVALAEKRITPVKAYSSGSIEIKGSSADLIKLRKLGL